MNTNAASYKKIGDAIKKRYKKSRFHKNNPNLFKGGDVKIHPFAKQKGKGKKNRNKIKIEPLNTIKKAIKNINPNSEINKKINKKKAEVASGNVKAKSQLAALKRKKKGVKLSDVRANQEKKMRESAKARHEQFKKDRAAKKAGKKTSYEGYKSAYDKRQAERKKAMQDRARARNEAFKNKRKLKRNKK